MANRKRAWPTSIGVAWMSTMSGPHGPHLVSDDDWAEEAELEDEGFGRAVAPVIEDGTDASDDGSWAAAKDLEKDKAWKAWLAEHMGSRDDVFLMVRVDEVDKIKVTQGKSRTTGERSFTYWLPVHEFLAEGKTVRDVMRAAYVHLYRRAAAKLALPTPPPDPGAVWAQSSA